MTVQTDVLALFNCIVIDPRQSTMRPYLGLAEQGIVLDFEPNAGQLDVLKEVFKPLRMETMFTREERESADLEDLLIKQFLHYLEVYGLGAPGLFDLTTDNGTLVSARYVAGVSIDDLTRLVQDLLYANAPVKDANQIKRIIDEFGIKFDIERVANNELRMMFWQDGMPPFKSGDDAVRWMCYHATGNAMLIKSREVIRAVRAASRKKFGVGFFEAHDVALAQVFNRHKKIILAAKNERTKTSINRIARMSKTLHVPIRESIAKTFVHRALAGEVDHTALGNVSIRDKMKYLNLLAERKLQLTARVYKVRNGKIWYDDDPSVYDLKEITRVEHWVLNSLEKDFAYLRGQYILLDPNVDYGLPTSRKQTLGRLPYGTKITSADDEISSGMYWEDKWGSRDLDLSGIRTNGDRIGWGTRRGFTDEGILFSGDVTSAPNGAMEFLTSRDEQYGVLVNIYAGVIGSEMELVVGRRSDSKKQWMDSTIVREKTKLESRQCLMGFVKDKSFTVFSGRLNNRSVSGNNPTLRAGEIEFWTVQKLFEALDIHFDVDRDSEVEYDHDLSYVGFSYDKLEALFKTPDC